MRYVLVDLRYVLVGFCIVNSWILRVNHVDVILANVPQGAQRILGNRVLLE
jgi:hypothetical protein